MNTFNNLYISILDFFLDSIPICLNNNRNENNIKRVDSTPVLFCASYSMDCSCTRSWSAAENCTRSMRMPRVSTTDRPTNKPGMPFGYVG